MTRIGTNKRLDIRTKDGNLKKNVVKKAVKSVALKNKIKIDMKKVLVHTDEDEDIHYIKGGFLSANSTLCGERLHPISTVHVHKFDVTCKKCLDLAVGIESELYENGIKKR